MEKLLPQNIEAECGVLGSIIIDPEAIVLVSDSLSARDFYRDAHRKIYDAIVHLYQSDEPADFITLCNELEGREQLADVGGASYITSLINQVPTSGNIEYYAQIVSKNSQLREAIHAAGQVAAEAYEPGADADEVIANAQKRYFEIALQKRREDFTASVDLMAGRIQHFDYLHQHRGVIMGVPTGFTDLDRMTGGLQKSDLIVLAARPGLGKTSFALCIGANAAIKHHQSVAIFSLEMSKEQLGARLLAENAGADLQKMNTGWLEQDEWERVCEAGDAIAESKLWIDDTAGITPMQMRSKARRLQSEQGVDLIIVDYLQLMRAESSRKHDNRVQEISEISRNLKEMARELHVPVLALSQLSRKLEERQNKVPQLSDLRESGAIEQDADIVLFIYRDEVYNPNTERPGIADIVAAKHRNGPVGFISLYWDAPSTRFRNMDERIAC